MRRMFDLPHRSYISNNYITSKHQLLQNMQRYPSSSSVIPRLVKHVVSMSANTLSLEDSREAQVLRHLVLRDDIVRAFRLTNDEFTDLGVYVSNASGASQQPCRVISYLEFSVRDGRA